MKNMPDKTKAELGLDEFREKYPYIYDAVFDRGKKAGIETGRFIERGMEKPNMPTPAGKNFESVVAEYIKNGETSAGAIRMAVKNYPDLHTEYIERLRTGKGEIHTLQKAKRPGKKKSSAASAAGMNNTPATFEEAVATEKETGLSLAKATRSAVLKYPELHTAYLQRLRGENGA